MINGKDLAPSKNLLKDYKEGRIEFQLFEKLFSNEISKNKNVIDICRGIAKDALDGKEFTLLCYEKEESNCHRKLIRKLCKDELLKLIQEEKNIKKYFNKHKFCFYDHNINNSHFKSN